MKQYNVIYADPPWLTTPSEKRNMKVHYANITIDNLRALPVKRVAANKSVLFLWVPSRILQTGIHMVRSWGFRYQTIAFVWVNKDREGLIRPSNLGDWTKENTKICLLATKGKPKPTGAIVQQLIDTPLDTFISRPDETRRRIVELMGDVPRLELFPQQKAPGWDVWGPKILNDPRFNNPNGGR